MPPNVTALELPAPTMLDRSALIARRSAL